MQTTKDSGSISRFNRLFVGLMRQNRSGVLLYTGILFGLYTVPTLLSILTEHKFFDYAVGAGRNFSYMSFVLFIGYMAIVPIALGGRLFGYMHSKRAVDLYHSLPVTRRELYLGYTAVGCVTLTIPVVFNLGLIFIVQLLYGAGAFIPAGILSLLLWLVSGYTLFAVTGFCAVNTGTPGDTTLFSIALNGAPAAIYLSMLGVNSLLLYGFYSDEMSMTWASRLSPLPTMVLREVVYASGHNGYNDPASYHTGITMLVWAVLAIGITLLSIKLYDRRKSEIAEVVGNLGPAQIIVRGLIYYLGSLLFAMFFYTVLNHESDIYFSLGAVLGAIVTGLIGEALLTRSPRATLQRLPSIIAVAVFAGAASFLYLQSGFGYETYLPAPGAVKSVKVEFPDGYQQYYGLKGQREQPSFTAEDGEVLSLLNQAHAGQLAGYKNNNEGRGSAKTISGHFLVTYNLKSGKTKTRSYYGIYPEAAEPLARLSMDSAYSAVQSEFFYIEPDWISSVGLISPLQDKTEETYLSSAQKAALLDAIRADVTSRDAQRYIEGAQPLGIIAINISYRVSERGEAIRPGDIITDTSATHTKQNTHTFTIYEGDDSTVGFLRKNGLSEHIVPDYTAVTEIFLLDSTDRYYRYGYDGLIAGISTSSSDELYYSFESYENEKGSSKYFGYYGSIMMPVETSRLDELLSLSKGTTPRWADDHTPIIAFRTGGEEKRIGYLYIDRESLPADIAARLEENRKDMYEQNERDNSEVYPEKAMYAF